MNSSADEKVVSIHASDTKGTIHAPHGVAGGWHALSASLHYAWKQRNFTRTSLALLQANQKDGFDCPGCAWPEGDDRAHAEFCENGVKAIAHETTSLRVTSEFFKQHAVASLHQQSDHWLEQQGRLTQPMQYNAAADRYEPITWPDSFATIAQHLNQLDHPDQAIFYTSGRTSNEAAFLYQLFGRMLGTNNFPDCSNMCHESSGVALSESIGVGKGTVTLEDFDHADAIFVIGQNPGTNHPRMLSTLQAASQRGCKIVTLNPLKEMGLEQFKHPQHIKQMLGGKATPITSLYLQPTIGGDLAALIGLIKHVLEAEAQSKIHNATAVLDHDFMRDHTQGFEALCEQVNATSWEVIEKQSALSREQLQLAADVYMQANNVIICWAMGLTQHKHAVATIQQAANLLMLRGNIGKPGAGACPVRGHSNVQGDRTMGISESPSPAFLQKLGETFAFTPPHKHGMDVVAAINAMHDGDGKVFVAMGGNFAAATPDTLLTYDAMKNCELTVHISTKLNRSHTVPGKQSIILPCLVRSEKDMQAAGLQKVTVEDSMSMVHASHGRMNPASNKLLSEPAIVAGMAAATFADAAKHPHAQQTDWAWLIEDYARIRDKIQSVLPDLFNDYNKRVSASGGFYLGNTARDRNWSTPDHKAHFLSSPVHDVSLPDGQLKLMTIRSHDQYNTTVYDMNDRYRGIKGTRKVIFMNEGDMHAQSLAADDIVNLIACWNDGKTRIAPSFRVVPYEIPTGCAAAYFPETNVLVSVDEFAHRSRTPVSKLIPIRLEKENG